MIARKYYEKNDGYKDILDALKKQFGEGMTLSMVQEAVRECNALCKEYDSLSKKEKLHTHQMIFPRAALYMQMTQHMPKEQAIGLLMEGIRIGVEPDMKRLQRLKDTLNDLKEMNAAGQREMELNPAYNPFEPGYAEALVDFIYEHYEGFKLLICCSEGSPYESFEEDLIRLETETNKEYAGLLQDKTGRRPILMDMEWHLLSTAYIHLISEIVRHDMPKADAKGHMEFVCRLLYPGWKELLGIKE